MLSAISTWTLTDPWKEINIAAFIPSDDYVISILKRRNADANVATYDHITERQKRLVIISFGSKTVDVP